MVSERIKTYLTWVVGLGSLLRIFPFTFDASNVSFKARRLIRINLLHFKSGTIWIELHNIIPLMCILVQLLNAAYLVGFLLLHPYSVNDTVICLMVLTAASGMALFVEIALFTDFRNYLAAINSLLRLDREFFAAGLSNNDIDKYDYAFGAMICSAIFTTAASFFVAIYIMEDKSFSVYRDFLIIPEEFPILHMANILALAVTVVCMVGLCWLVIVLTMILMTTYSKTMELWMVMMKKAWVHKLVKGENVRRLETYLRAACLLYVWMTEVHWIIVPTFVGTGELIIISSLYLAIRLNVAGGLLSVLSAAIGLTCIGAFKVSLDFGTTTTSVSKDCIEAPNREAGARLSKLDKCFLASCKPLTNKVGGLFTITQETLPTASQDVILGNLINLLVSY